MTVDTAARDDGVLAIERDDGEAEVEIGGERLAPARSALGVVARDERGGALAVGAAPGHRSGAEVRGAHEGADDCRLVGAVDCNGGGGGRRREELRPWRRSRGGVAGRSTAIARGARVARRSGVGRRRAVARRHGRVGRRSRVRRGRVGRGRVAIGRRAVAPPAGLARRPSWSHRCPDRWPRSSRPSTHRIRRAHRCRSRRRERRERSTTCARVRMERGSFDLRVGIALAVPLARRLLRPSRETLVLGLVRVRMSLNRNLGIRRVIDGVRRLVDIWLRSVRATHDFLTEDDLASLIAGARLPDVGGVGALGRRRSRRPLRFHGDGRQRGRIAVHRTRGAASWRRPSSARARPRAPRRAHRRRQRAERRRATVRPGDGLRRRAAHRRRRRGSAFSAPLHAVRGGARVLTRCAPAIDR